MKELFDKTLRNHIKDTFGDFDDHLADDGWRKLNDRKKRKQRGFIFWYILPSGTAASIALFLLLNQSVVAPFQNGKTEEKTKVAAKQNPSTDFNNVDSEKSNLEQKTTVFSQNYNELKITRKEDLKTKKSYLNVDKAKLVKKSTLNQKKTELASLNSSVEKEIITVDNSKIIKNENALSEEITQISTFPKELEFTKSNNTNSFNERVQEISTQKIGFTAPKENLNRNATINSLEKPIESYQKLAVLNLAKAETKNTKPIQTSKKFKIGIDANTYFNFSENGIDDKINLGLGLVSEIKLTRQFSINTGVTLNSQNSTFNGNQKSTQDFLRSAVAFSNFATVPSAQVTNAKLVGLDIPLNLKYAVNFGKTTGFITSGFSSYSVINEKYVNKFSVINYSFNGVSTSSVTNVNNNPAGKFSYFKFARTLDVSMGILYPLSKKSTLSIEPFMKYPLSGLGYQDLKIGSSGISFKMNFGK